MQLNQRSNFLLFLLPCFYKKTLRNKTQLKKEHTVLGYWPGITHKSNSQSIWGQCKAHIEVESTAWTCYSLRKVFWQRTPLRWSGSTSHAHLCRAFSHSHVGWLRQTSSRDEVLETHASDLGNRLQNRSPLWSSATSKKRKILSRCLLNAAQKEQRRATFIRLSCI